MVLARRYLVQFDIAGSLPAGATILGVSLNINILNIAPGSSFNDIQHVHRLSQAWGEGASDAGLPGGQGTAAQAGDAAWFHTFYTGGLWTTPGGDFAPTPSGVFNFNTFGPLVFTSPGMLSDVQSWLDFPATNFGWILKDSDENSHSAQAFSTREDPFPNAAPFLVVDYTTGHLFSTFCDPADNNSTGFPTALIGSDDLGQPIGRAPRSHIRPPEPIRLLPDRHGHQRPGHRRRIGTPVPGLRGGQRLWPLQRHR